MLSFSSIVILRQDKPLLWCVLTELHLYSAQHKPLFEENFTLTCAA